MSKRLNFNNTNGKMPDGGFPLYIDDIGRIEKKTRDTLKGIINGLTDYDNAEFTPIEKQQLDTSNFIVSGCTATVALVSGDTYGITVSSGVVYINDELIEVDTDYITYTYTEDSILGSPFVDRVKLAITESDLPRLYQNATTNNSIKEFGAELTLDLTRDGIVLSVNDSSGSGLRLVDIIGSQQIAAEKTRLPTNDYRGNSFNKWNFDDTSKSIVEKSGSYVHYSIPFVCQDATAANAAGVTYVWTPLFDYLPAQQVCSYGQFPSGITTWLCASEQPGGLWRNDTAAYFDSGGGLNFFKLDSPSASTFVNGEVVYFSTTVPARN